MINKILSTGTSCRQKKVFYTVTARVIALLVCTASVANAQPCDDAIRYLDVTSALVQRLPPYPGNERQADSLLAIFKRTDPASERKLREAILFGEKKRKEDSAFLQCIVSNAHRVDNNYLNWQQFLAGHYIKLSFRSPEFVRGFGLHIDLNQGVADLGQSSESYTFAARTLLSYTFVSKDAPTNAGGHVRLLGGVSTYYTNGDLAALANLRAEFRVLDIGNELTSIGNVKLIADANYNNDMTIIGGGAGLEIYKFGIQVLYQHETVMSQSHLLLGIFYRIHLSKP